MFGISRNTVQNILKYVSGRNFALRAGGRVPARNVFWRTLKATERPPLDLYADP